jgi:hypothetical protein
MSNIQKVELKLKQIETMFDELDNMVKHTSSKVGSRYSSKISGEVMALRELGRSLVSELRKVDDVKQSL